MKFINNDVKWGIIGCGNVCEVKSGPAFGKIKGSSLAAVMRRNVNKARDYAQRHGVPKFYDNAEQLIDDPDINAVYIATPPASHEEYTIRSLQAGKPVYIEKPVTVNSQSLGRMIEASHKYDLPVTVAHYRRALPLYQKVRALIKEGVLGEIRLVLITLLQSASSELIAVTDENWRTNPILSGGGLFHDLSPHQLDILYWLFGEPKEVKGWSANQGKLYNAPDLAFLEAAYKDNIYFKGVWSFNAAQSASADKCEIIGSKGMVSFPFFHNPILQISTDAGSEAIAFTYPEHIQQPMITEVVNFFKGDGPNPCSLEEALVSMKMMDTTLIASSAKQ